MKTTNPAPVVNLTERQKALLAFEQIKVLLCLDESQRAIAEALKSLPKVFPGVSESRPRIYPVTQAAWKAALAQIEKAEKFLRMAARITGKKIAHLGDQTLLLKNEDMPVSDETAQTVDVALKGRGRPRNEYREFIEQDREKGLDCSTAKVLVRRHHPESKGAVRTDHRIRFKNALKASSKTALNSRQ